MVSEHGKGERVVFLFGEDGLEPVFCFVGLSVFKAFCLFFDLNIFKTIYIKHFKAIFRIFGKN